MYNQYKQYFDEKSIDYDERWLKRYFNFIEQFKTLTHTYTERHHILPKSLFPEYRNLREYHWNGVDLTARVHFLAHYMLAKAINKLWKASACVYETNQNLIPNSMLYEVSKIEANKRLSDRQRGDNNVAKRPDVRKKMSESAKGRPSSMKGTKSTYETRKKQSDSAKKRTPNRKKTYHLIDHSGNITECVGNLKKTVEEYNLSLNTLKTNIGNVVQPLSKDKSHYETFIRNNTNGWKLVEI